MTISAVICVADTRNLTPDTLRPISVKPSAIVISFNFGFNSID